MDVAPHNMISNTAPSPYVASASGEYPGGYEAYHGFDGTDSIWASDTTIGWIKIDLGAGNTYKIGSYALKSRLSYTDQMARDWTLQGSNDNINWDVLDAVTGETNWGDLEKRGFDCDVVTTAYRYFKINITANNGNAFATSISEIYLYLLQVSLYHGLRVQSVGELVLCDVGNCPLRIRKGGITYGIALVDTSDPDASAIRIKTGAGIKAIKKYPTKYAWAPYEGNGLTEAIWNYFTWG